MKKNIREIPSSVRTKLKSIQGNFVVAGCAKQFAAQDLQNGRLSHLGVSVTPAGLSLPDQVMPPASQGKYSERNLHGQEIKRTDLPKETHYRSMEVPNWGNSWKGTHTVNMPYQAFPREFHPPRELVIKMDCLNKSPELSGYQIAFQVDEVLDKTAKGFETNLLQNLNLLQENIGACGIMASDVSLSGYFQTLHVSWELLPPGTKPALLQRLFQGRNPTSQQQDVASDRYDFFQNLKSKQLVFGSSGLRRYFGALIEDGLVVFENIEYGNAVYVLFGDWKELSKKSRIELLSGQFDKDFVRVVHLDGWKDKVQKIVSERRKTK